MSECRDSDRPETVRAQKSTPWRDTGIPGHSGGAPPPSNARLCAIPSLLGRDKAQVILVACGEGVAGTGELAQKVEQVFRKVTKGPASLQVAQGTQCLGLSWGF